MNANQLVFDDSIEMHIVIEGQNSKVSLILADWLSAFEEELTDRYKEKIVDFINGASVWYKKAVQTVIDRSRRVYSMEATEQDLKLQIIYVLFEQNEAPLFGLSFRTEFDIEHGCGLKIDGDNFDIAEVGTADIAFC